MGSCHDPLPTAPCATPVGVSSRSTVAQASHTFCGIRAMFVGILRKSQSQEQTADRVGEEPHEHAGAKPLTRDEKGLPQGCNLTHLRPMPVYLKMGRCR